jgi:hypothetical protein
MEPRITVLVKTSSNLPDRPISSSQDLLLFICMFSLVAFQVCKCWGFHGGDCRDCSLLGWYREDSSVEQAASIFKTEYYANALTRKKMGESTWILIVTWSAYYLTLKMEAVCSSETYVNFDLRHIPEDITSDFISIAWSPENRSVLWR